MLDALTDLSTAQLRILADAFRQGAMSQGLSEPVLVQIAGDRYKSVRETLDTLALRGMTAQHVSILLEGILAERLKAPDLASVIELVLSGPEVQGVPSRDTGPALISLIQEAQDEIILSTYVLHNTEQILNEIARQMQVHGPKLRVMLYVHIGRSNETLSSDQDIIRRFHNHFVERHWPWLPRPTVYFDPRGLAVNSADRASLHAKCIIIDRQATLITSANFTGAAQKKNIELGVIIRHPTLARKTAEYFEALVAAGLLQECR
jgi:phosphatidylserine/phosphatidylglycerophosphate/cardiolipin synthase-like enzyme